MNLRLLYLYRNLTRNLLRTALTCLAVALPIAIYVLSAAVIDGINRFLDNSAKQLRLTVIHKASIIHTLPEAYRAKMESLDPTRARLTSVCGMRWVGGRIDGKQLPLSTLAVDPDTFIQTFPEMSFKQPEIDAWYRDRQAIMVGKSIAGQLGWNVGDRVSLRLTVPPHTLMEFHVVSTLPDALDNITLWCRRDYLEAEFERLDRGIPKGQISFYFVKCGGAADVNHFRQEIDKLFANALDPTKTQDEKAFMNEYISQQFDLPKNLRILSAITVLVAILAAANTMSMNFRDRINEFATMKSLGFGGSLVFGLVQTESLLLCAIGGLAGALVPYVAFTHTPLKNFTVPLIQALVVQPNVCLQAFLISLAIGLLAAAWPSWLAIRMPVVSALRDLG